jgi:uncharacterized protein
MPATFIDRHIRPTVVEALKEARAVCLLGPRQAGKSTLARAIAQREHPAQYLTLDDDAVRRSALDDPTGFIARISGHAVIDEVQRAPDSCRSSGLARPPSRARAAWRASLASSTRR